jgi:hypothetical protein
LAASQAKNEPFGQEDARSGIPGTYIRALLLFAILECCAGLPHPLCSPFLAAIRF